MPRRASAAALLFVSSALPGAAGAGLTTCPCINDVYSHSGLEALSNYLDANNNLIYTPAGGSVSYSYPATYGNGACLAHDQGLPPVCSGSSAPSWCSVKWCYVDVNNCEGASVIKTRYFTDVSNLHFSYGTCTSSGTNTYDTWTSEDIAVSRNMITLVEGYARSTRLIMQAAYEKYMSNVTCDVSSRTMCTCSNCYASTTWNNAVSFSETGVLTRDAASSSEQALGKCLSDSVATTYERVAAVEADADFMRVGYQYAADQLSGTYTQWPKMDMCEQQEADYDPRFRPWYAAAATGPKDVIIIVDVSGSMATSGRHVLAKSAVKAILNTLSWKDFATIILFNGAVSAVYSSTLVAVTDNVRSAMSSWCDRQVWQSGGTNFLAPITKAYEIMQRSLSAGTSSMCQRAVMFLTDGVATLEESDLTAIKTKAETYDAIFFTYALGDGADVTLTKRLACDNKGVFYAIPDNGDVAGIMSKYYEYFAHGQEICSASWVRYSGVGTGATLYAGCMAMYDRTDPSADLLGVSCMDINLIADMAEFKESAGWDQFVCTASDITKKCRSVQLTQCHRQKIRLAYSEDSVCTGDDFDTVTADQVCPCVVSDCSDDNDFTDELGYFCDTWVGDDCYNPNPTWGYTEAGLTEVRSKCPASCGICEWSSGSCPKTAAEECPVLTLATECRACLGLTSGVDLEGNAMACPEGSPRNIAPTTTRTTTGVSLAAPLSLSFGTWIVSFMAAVLASAHH